MKLIALIIWLIAANAFGQFNFSDIAFNAPRTTATAETYNLYTNYSGTSARGGFNGLVGMIWTNTVAITVTHLGTWVTLTNNPTQQLQLVNWTNLTAVASVWINTSNSASAVFIYTNISPVTLIAGTVYCMVRNETNGTTVFQDGGGVPRGVFSSGTYGGRVYSTAYLLSGLGYEAGDRPYGPHDVKYTLP